MQWTVSEIKDFYAEPMTRSDGSAGEGRWR
jgi:hypothetical protein